MYDLFKFPEGFEFLPDQNSYERARFAVDRAIDAVKATDMRSTEFYADSLDELSVDLFEVEL